MATERSGPVERPVSPLARVRLLYPEPSIRARSLNAWVARMVERIRERAWDDQLIARDRADLLAYMAGAVLLAVTAVPFLVLGFEGASAGLSGVPTPGIWDHLGRAQALADQGPLPLMPVRGATSPLWIWLLAAAYKPLGFVGVPIAVVAKVLGLVVSLGILVAVYNVALRLTGSRWPAGLALGLLALDPFGAFGRVSASEAALYSLTVGLACLALIRRRADVLGPALVGIVLARSDGALVALLIVGALGAEALWRRGEPVAAPERDLTRIGWLVAPASTALALLGLVGLMTAGQPLPSVLPSLSAETPGFLARLVNLWSGFLGAHPAFASGMFVVTAGAWGWTTARAVRIWGPRGAVPGLIPLVLIGSALASAPGGAWTYDVRRVLEPALPWIALALAVALTDAGQVIWNAPRPGLSLRFARFERWHPAGLLALLPLLLWSLNGIPVWYEAARDYALGARNVADVPMAAGQWLAATAARETRVGIAPGAEPVRATASRTIVDMPVAAEPAIAREMARELGLEYVVAYRGTSVAGWPIVQEVARLATSRNVALPGPELVVFRLDWSAQRLDAGRPLLLRLDGFVVLDALDVGDPAAETRHLYASAAPGTIVRSESAAAGGFISDDGRAQEVGRGAESFTMAARANADLLLAVRYDSASRGVLRVELERQPFDLRLRECAAVLCEDALVLPAQLVRSTSVRLTITFSGGAGRIAPYHYWTIARQ